MKRDRRISARAAELYRKAEDKVALLPARTGTFSSDTDAKRLLHELQVHQIELEMQNSELQQSTDALELALEEYRTLYDFAPVGYMSLDREGHILKNNLAGAALVDMSRSQIIRTPFARFVADADRPRFATFLKQVFTEFTGKTTCELRLIKGGSEPIFARLEVQTSGSSLECLVAIIDVTNLRLEEQKFRVVADKLAHSFDELEILTAELNLSEERERRRIALALHDQVVQNLAIGKLNLDAALRKGEIPEHPVLQELQAMLEASMLELRDLSLDLSPPILYDLGLRAAIACLGGTLEKKFGFRFMLHSDCPQEALFREELTISVFQFCRELLMNTAKHSSAATVTVLLYQKGSRLTLTIDDDGIGFDASNYHEGFGLANIRQRVNYLRGTFRIESKPGAGTRAEISLDTQHAKSPRKEWSHADTSAACR